MTSIYRFAKKTCQLVINWLLLCAGIIGVAVVFSWYGMQWGDYAARQLSDKEQIRAARDHVAKVASQSVQPEAKYIRVLRNEKDKKSEMLLEKIYVSANPVTRLLVAEALLTINPKRQNASDLLKDIKSIYPFFDSDEHKLLAVRTVAYSGEQAKQFLCAIASDDASLSVRLEAIRFLTARYGIWGFGRGIKLTVEDKHLLAADLLFVVQKMDEFIPPPAWGSLAVWMAARRDAAPRYGLAKELAKRLRGCGRNASSMDRSGNSLYKSEIGAKQQIIYILTEGECS